MDALNDERPRPVEVEAVEPKHAIVEEDGAAAQTPLQELFLRSPAVIYVCKPGGDYGATFISENVRHQLGYDSREFIDASAFWVNRIHPEDVRSVLAELPRLFAAGEHVHEYRFLHKDGTYRWMRDECRLVRDAHGNPLEIVGVWIDITERKRTEEALRESEQKYRNIIENAVEGIFQATPEGRYLSVNPAFARMCGFGSPAEMIEEITDIAQQLYVNPEDRKRIKRLYDDPGFAKGFEAQFRRKDGGLIWVSITARSIRDEGGALLRYEGTIEDITERKRAEIEIQKHREQLRLLASELSLTEERQRRRLATDLHDSIGQTLAMCKLRLDELQSQAPSAVLASDLGNISTLLDRAIQGARSLTFELSPPVLYELGIEAALESLVERMQQTHNIQIRLSDRGGPKLLSEDTAAFCFRAVQELLVNVIKHAHARKIEVSTGINRGRVRITVADDGIGFGTRESISRKEEKGGFGLFNIRERLQHLGGSLKVDSKLRQGTRITLSVPVKHHPTKKRPAEPHHY
jgi:PAS domain S-box-containing protein